ncbi:SCO family protein [Chromobacterium alticapitis]|nr:SCO family protein [Chromobacterium alticapitis]
MSRWNHGLAAALLLAACHVATAALPGDSLYQLDAPMRAQNGQPFKMADLAGKPALVTMFYGSCQLACPIVFHHMEATVAALPAAARGKLTAVMISLDPKEDTADSLRRLAHEHGMDGPGWVWAVSDTDEHTRGVAAALGIRYRRLEDGTINHSTRVLLLDRQGRVAAATDDIGTKPDAGLLAKLRELTRR